jgi:hypothetical protein
VDEPGRGGGEGDRGGLVVDPGPSTHELPGQDDVLADGVGPATRLQQRLGPVEAEGALGDQRALVEPLHPLHRRDAQEVVPFLHPGPEVVAAVADQHRPGDGLHIGRGAQQTGHELADGLGVQQRVGVQGDDQLRLHGRQAGVEGVALAGTWLVDAADPLAGGGPVRFGQGPGPVGGAVVDHQDLDGPRIVLAGDVGDRLLDPVGLVAGGDQHRDRDGRMRPAQGWLAVQQQADRQERDQPAREVGDEADDQDRRDHRDRRGELTNPGQRQQHRQAEPTERGYLGDHELPGHRDIPAPPGRRRLGPGTDRCPRLLIDTAAVCRPTHPWLPTATALSGHITSRGEVGRCDGR